MEKTGFFAMMKNPHYRMERFAVMVLAFVFVLASIFGICLKRQHDSNQLVLGAQSQYTNQTVFSLTGETLDVVGSYRDSNFTKYFVLLKSSSMDNLPTTAEGYQMYMTAYDSKKPLKCNPQGAIYVFGNTGYIGLYFHDEAGFPSNMYDVTVRNWSMVAEGDPARAQTLYSDPSFWSYNQISLHANFAGTAAPVAGFLDAGSFTAEDAYSELVLDVGSEPLRAKMNERLYTMNQAMNAINLRRDKLGLSGIVVPDLPVSIAGDMVTSNPELTRDNPSCFDVSMLSAPSDGDKDYDISVDVEDEGYVSNDKLYLVTDYVFPGGVQYNYQDVSVSDRILDQLKPEELTYAQWTNSKSVEANTYGTSTQKYTWKYKDGRMFRADENAKSAAIQTDIAGYETAVNTMISEKKALQTSDLYELLKVDETNRGISDLFTVVARQETLILY